MIALSPAFVVVDRVAGLNLNHRKRYRVPYGSDSFQDLLGWVATNCEEFREMKIAKYAKYVGTMIGLDEYLHRWSAPRKKFIQRARKRNESTKSLVERLVDFKIHALSVLGYLGSISAPDRATIKEEGNALQCITAGSYNATLTILLGAGSTCGQGLDIFWIRILSLRCTRQRSGRGSCSS